MKRTIASGFAAAASVAALVLAWNATAPKPTRPAAENAPAVETPDETTPKPAPAPKTPTPPPAPPNADDPRAVLVLYRTNCDDFNKNGMGDSEEIARYYAERRGVPKENILGIKVTGNYQDVYGRGATWDYREFQVQLIQPLRKKLQELRPDKILYIVTVFGMPIRLAVPGQPKAISADAAISNPFLVRDDGLHLKRFYFAVNNPAPTRYNTPRFATARAQWEGKDAPDNITYLVSRLDGMGVPTCKSQVDTAIYAEKYNVDGWAYVDTRFGTYTDKDLEEWQKQPYYFDNPMVDKGVAMARPFFQQAGVKVRQQPDGDVIGATKTLKYTDGTSATTAPRALGYSGWYNYGEYKNVFDWMPGSVAMDFDSVSLYSPREFMASFGGMALLNGASGAVGCFDEPYTTGHPRPDILFYYYTRGYNFAEASWLSIPSQPYYDYGIGDPLMRPYGRKREADTRIETPTVNWKRDGGDIRADVTFPGVEVARAQLIVTKRKDDALLPPASRHDGVFRHEMSLTGRIPKEGPAFAGLVLTDPAGNTTRVWKDLRAGD